MPLNTVQMYVRELLDGLVMPGQAKPLRAFITPPTNTNLNGPVAMVWGGRARVHRQTMPRGQGFKQLDWIIDVYLSFETVPASVGLDQAFPLIVDAVMNKTFTTVMPLFYDDPTTGQVSQILSIGEQLELDYPPERTPATQRMLYYTCRLGLDLMEVIQL